MARPSEHRSLREPVDLEESERLAEAMSAFTAPSRLRLLYALAAGEQTVEQLAERAQLSPTVASQQLRVLRQLQTVAVRRDGRHGYYRLRDHHIADLLAAVRHHGEHRPRSSEERPAAEPEPA